ncbi:MAG: hypothetical protein GTO18_21765 [Anaerolineales bacterium]|nr:hypothetical protein [Anaerolineales bacterium]
MTLLRRFFTRYFQAPRLTVFETEVGVKYRFGRFDSNKFVDYVIQEVPFQSLGISFSDLVLPPDLLRDRYTLCGMALPLSPHFQLMEEIDTGTLAMGSEYMSRCKMGTLDARLPSNPRMTDLTQQYWRQKKEMIQHETVTISVIKVSLGSRQKYVIADGKHRAAMVAYFDRPEYLHLRLLSNAFTQDPFFQHVYSYTLGLDSHEYSINQDVIRAILDES